MAPAAGRRNRSAIPSIGCAWALAYLLTSSGAVADSIVLCLFFAQIAHYHKRALDRGVGGLRPPFHPHMLEGLERYYQLASSLQVWQTRQAV